jgi:hypothetical protein
MRERRAILAATGLLFLAGPLAAQTSEPGLPRVIYGATPPQVLYGPSSAPPAAPEAPRIPPPAPQQAPQGSLTYESGPAYVPPPAYWVGPPAHWRPPPRHVGPPIVNPQPYLPPDTSRFERPLPQGRYVGRPPSAPPEPYRYGRPPGY